MMTQPIQMFENLTSETTPAGRNDIAKVGFSLGDRQMIELRARYARAELMANALGDTLLWMGLTPTQVLEVLPNLSNFKNRKIGYL